MHVAPLSNIMGIEVSDVNLSCLRSDEEGRQLKRLYDEHGLLVFRGQGLSKQQLVDAGEIFGGTQMTPPATTDDPDVCGIVVISTRGTTGDVEPEDQDALVGDLEWHTDQGYVPAPNRGKILYAVQVPAEGGRTGFIDNQLTYKALSDDMKQRLDGLHVLQSWNRAESYLERNRDYRVGGDQQLVSNKFPDMVYPLIYDHPLTGAKVLNVIPLWDAGIVELPGAEGDDLLEELKAHVTRPEFQYWHQYEVGDAVLWDNWRLLHAASGTPGRYVRTLWSIVIQSGPVFGHAIGS